ncbi:uncharacterized protein V1516DRAFT_620340 [Lipomyces oligophaga]|uniref:uncharacterized protein n=1 Tax=Lipomyces oligophaga TaxID=45792 RepID=UPI0034CD812C
MHFHTTLLLVEVGEGELAEVDFMRKYSAIITQALHVTQKKGRLEILIVNPPERFVTLHYYIARLYVLAGRIGRDSEIDVRVLMEGVGGFEVRSASQRGWEAVAVCQEDEKLIPLFVEENHRSREGSLQIVIFPMRNQEIVDEEISDGERIIEDRDIDTNVEEEEEQGLEGEYPSVAVGGTFDHLHEGHKILLTMSGFICGQKLVIGVTGEKLLKNKAYKEFLEPYETRSDKVLEFVHSVFPALQATTHELEDVYGGAVRIAELEALVCSEETRQGAIAVNEERRRRGLKSLCLWAVGLVQGEDGLDKLGSTAIRRRLSEKQSLKQRQGEGQA